MGDISAEPSMEDILSSIKRIIAEENDAPTRGKRPPRPRAEPFGHDEVLELNEHAPEPAYQPARELAADPVPAPVAAAPAPAYAAPVAAAPAPVYAAPVQPDPILSPRAAEASRSPLDALSRLVIKPEVPGSDTLEGMVREMLRPMLRDWLDAHLPAMVEQMVAREIDRITGK